MLDVLRRNVFESACPRLLLRGEVRSVLNRVQTSLIFAHRQPLGSPRISFAPSGLDVFWDS
jgi:hypothetical protein